MGFPFAELNCKYNFFTLFLLSENILLRINYIKVHVNDLI